MIQQDELCPYPGPRPYTTEQQGSFFGRQTDCENLKSLLISERIVFLHGASGTGKSSLINAGLIPDISNPKGSNFRVINDIRISMPIPTELQGAVLNRFAYSLMASIEQSIREEQINAGGNDAGGDHEIFNPGELASFSPSTYVNRRLLKRTSKQHILLIFDQFEELFSCADAKQDEQIEFLSDIHEILQNPNIWAVFALRDEYMPDLIRYRKYIPSHIDNTYPLDYLTPDAATDAISSPARSGGGHIPPDTIELLLKLLRLNEASPNKRGRIDPLHLQLACVQLWEKRKRSPRDTGKKLSAQGSASPDYSWFIDNTVVESTLAGKEKDVVTASLRKYIDSTIAEIAQRSANNESALRAWLEETLIRDYSFREKLRPDNEQQDAVARALDGAHILRFVPNVGARWYELAHDKLVDPFVASCDRWFVSSGKRDRFIRNAREYCRRGRPKGFPVLGQSHWPGKKLRSAPLSKGTSDGEAENILRPTRCQEEYLKYCKQKQNRKFYVWAFSTIVMVAIISLVYSFQGQFELTELKKKRVELEGTISNLSDRKSRINFIRQLMGLAQLHRWRYHNHDYALLATLYAEKIAKEKLEKKERPMRAEFEEILYSALTATPFSGVHPGKGVGGSTARLITAPGGALIARRQQSDQLLVGNIAYANNESNSGCLLNGRPKTVIPAGEQRLLALGADLRLYARPGCELQWKVDLPRESLGDKTNLHQPLLAINHQYPALVGAQFSPTTVGFVRNVGENRVWRQLDLKKEFEMIVGDSPQEGLRITAIAAGRTAFAIGDNFGHVCLVKNPADNLHCDEIVYRNAGACWPFYWDTSFSEEGPSECRPSSGAEIVAMAIGDTDDSVWVVHKGSTQTAGGRIFRYQGGATSLAVTEIFPNVRSRTEEEVTIRRGISSRKLAGERWRVADFSYDRNNLQLVTGGSLGRVVTWDLSGLTGASELDEKFLSRILGPNAFADLQNESGTMAKQEIKDGSLKKNMEVRAADTRKETSRPRSFRYAIEFARTRLLHGLDEAPVQLAIRSGEAVYALNDDSSIRYWQFDSNPMVRSSTTWQSSGASREDMKGFLYSMGLTNQGRLVTTTNRGEVAFWEYPKELGRGLKPSMASTIKVESDQSGREYGIRSIDINDNDLAVLGRKDGTVWLLNLSKSASEAVAINLTTAYRGDEPLHNDGLWEVVFRPDNADFEKQRDIISGSYDGVLVFWDVALADGKTGESITVDCVERVDLKDPIGALAVDPTGRYLFVGTHPDPTSTAPSDETVGRLFDLDQGRQTERQQPLQSVWELKRTKKGFTDLQSIRAASFSSDGLRLALAGDNGKVVEIAFADSNPVQEEPEPAMLLRRDGHRGRIPALTYAVSHDPSEYVLLTASYDGKLGIWRSAKDPGLARAVRPSFLTNVDGLALESVAVSKDGAIAFAGSGNRRIHAWRLRPRELACEVLGARRFSEKELRKLTRSNPMHRTDMGSATICAPIAQ